MNEIDELVQFLQPDSRFDLKRFATMTVAQLTGTSDGINLLQKNEKVLKCLLQLIHDQELNTAKDSFKTIINVAAEEDGVNSLLLLNDLNIIKEMMKCIEDKDFIHANYACGVLANLTRTTHHCQVTLELMEKANYTLDSMVSIFCQTKYNNRGCNLHLLAPFFSNISQTSMGRKLLMDKKKHNLERIIPFIDNLESKGRRKSVIGAIHNCCFDKEDHKWLLSEEVDLATRLVYPLAGSDTFTEEENDSLPLDLQFLPDDKVREEDPEIRKLLLEALMQLCQTKESRETLRNQNIYLILREHHKWEEDKHCIMLNEDIVNLIVRTEEEIGAEDITALSVPEDLIPKFVKMDETYLADEIAETDKITQTVNPPSS